MNVITRFAPSPTGFLHIGGARTALFNWLFARHYGGQFLLRIEDTDRLRSTAAATDAILDGLRWLGLDWDGDTVFQSACQQRHAEVAAKMLQMGHAYRCYATPAELQTMREQQKAAGLPMRYDGNWRDRPASDAPAGVAPAIRLRAPLEGETIIDDAVQGMVRVGNAQLDDLILLRADGTPTYMLSVVVDDHDMGITHVIRGDDHLTNAFRQLQIYRALEWECPRFAHIPLIHGADGAKLSKRHGALGVDAYRDMGYLPEALRNYLLRLGWAHGDDEIISTEQAIQWFDLPAVGRSPARFDFTKLNNVNSDYIRRSDDERLVELVSTYADRPISASQRKRLLDGMPGLKSRAKTLVELTAQARFYLSERPIGLDDAALKLVDDSAKVILKKASSRLSSLDNWSMEATEQCVRDVAEEAQVKLGAVAQPLRAALTGAAASPSLFEIMVALGREESLGRIDDAAI